MAGWCNGNIQVQYSCATGSIPVPASISFAGVVKCTFSRKRSLKSFVVLVVFSFSLVVACISPAWADTVSTTSEPFTVYVGVPGSDPYYQGKPFTLPVTESSIIHTYTKGSYNWEFGLIGFHQKLSINFLLKK